MKSIGGAKDCYLKTVRLKATEQLVRHPYRSISNVLSSGGLPRRRVVDM